MEDQKFWQKYHIDFVINKGIDGWKPIFYNCKFYYILIINLLAPFF